LLLLGLLPSAVLAQECQDASGQWVFAQKTYKVREVRVESVLDFLHAVSSQLNAIKPELELKAGDNYDADKSARGRELIENRLREAEKNAEPMMRVLYVRARVENCDAVSAPEPQLDVVYRVLTTNYNAYLSHTWELKQEEVERPATAAAKGQVKGFLTIRPFVNYNRTRRLLGGGQLILKTPGGIFDNVRVNVSGSKTGNVEDFELNGSRTPRLAALESLEYRVGYKHSDLPAAGNRLRTGTFFAQVFGASPPLGSKGVILRYGGTLEGGNQQTDLVAAANAARSEARSGYGGLKTYFGATLRRKDYSLAASYGLQVGARGATTDIDFVKHIANATLTGEWALGEKKRACGQPHKPLTLEAMFAGGRIQSKGRVPVAQRFFGGNVEREFIEGDSWRILGGPYIRSIPENRLNADSAPGAVGGTSFYSVNLTVSRPVWGKPIIPKEMECDENFIPNLTAAKESTRQLLTINFINSEVPSARFTEIIAALTDPAEKDPPTENSVQVLMNQVGELIEGLPEEVTDDPPREPPCTEEEAAAAEEEGGEPCTLYKSALTNVITGYETINVTLDDDEELRQNLPGKLFSLLKDSDPDGCATDRDKCSLVSKLRRDLDKLAELLLRFGLSAEAAQRARDLGVALAAQQAKQLPVLMQIDIHEAREEADTVIAQLEPVLDAFLYKLNAVTVSPLGMFDAARLWPDRNGTRYGIGGGVRVTVVNFNMTFGYAVNPDPKPREGRGAFFFKMDVTDIFR
jgi:hypothetical protein